jgi:parallel beta-helix repeat protein
MKFSRLMACVMGATLAAAACGDNGGNDGGPDAAPDATPDNFPTNKCMATAKCTEVRGGDVTALLTATNSLEAGSTLILGEGTFAMTNTLSIGTSAHIVGQGIDKTILDFGDATTQGNGVEVIEHDDFLIQDLTVLDAPKDGIRVESSDGVVFRRIRATWSTPGASTNGAYGIYPVKSKNVLVEDSQADGASDAGLYVGQCQHVIVRRNKVNGNVAGLEIENTQYADVYENIAEDNTAGIVVFDLPGNPVIGRDVRLRDNTIRNNNHVNFAPGGTVKMIPVGTGTFAMASRRVEITNNTYANNNTGDIALLSGLVVEEDVSKWTIAKSAVVGTYDDLDLLPGAAADTVMNFRSEDIVVSGNKHSGSGTRPDGNDPKMLGLLLAITYGTNPIDNILYDAIGEPSFNSTDPVMNTNANHICVGGNTMGTFASMNLAAQDITHLVPFFRPASPFAPFECTALKKGPIAAVVLP